MSEMDRYLRLMADAPLPAALDRLESDVLRRITSARAEAIVAPLWRYAAVCVALVVGVGFGASSAIALRGTPVGLVHYLTGADLAPSSLLPAS